MTIHGYVNILIGATALIASTQVSYAADPCATFVWTAAQQAPVERYKPRYLSGEGLEDVHLDQIVGTRIRHQWSTQAATCIASSNHYGYFAHPDFNQIACTAGESCFPGTRLKRMSERLTDVLSVAQQLATPNADATYQANLNTARVASYVVIDGFGAAPLTTASFYANLVGAYTFYIDQFAAVTNQLLSTRSRLAVLDALCSPDNVTQMDRLTDECPDCRLTDMFNTIDFCFEYQNGAALDQVLAQASSLKSGLEGERDRLAAEHDQILSLWSQIQNLRPSSSSLPPTCNIHYSFGTAQLPISDFPADRYGADLRYLYGDWQWSTFGVSTSTIKASLYVHDIANLVDDCVGDARYGRLDFRRRQVAAAGGGVSDETDNEYYMRMVGGAVALKAELGNIETNYTDLVHTHAPLVPDSDIDGLKTMLSNTQLHVLDLTADRTTGLGWVMELVQDVNDAADRFTQANLVARALITVDGDEFPGKRDQVIQLLIDTTTGLLADYGAFFSPEKQANLQLLLLDLVIGNDDNPEQVIEFLKDTADAMQAEIDGLFDANEPLEILAGELKFIFGGCNPPPGPHPLLTYFGDLPVAARIVQEGNNAQFCNQ